MGSSPFTSTFFKSKPFGKRVEGLFLCATKQAADAGRKIKGRKRHLLVDTIWLGDCDGAKLVFAKAANSLIGRASDIRTLEFTQGLLSKRKPTSPSHINF